MQNDLQIADVAQQLLAPSSLCSEHIAVFLMLAAHHLLHIGQDLCAGASLLQALLGGCQQLIQPAMAGWLLSAD